MGACAVAARVGSCSGSHGSGPSRGAGGGGEGREPSPGTMSDAGGGKKPPVDPQAGPGPGPGRAAGERGLSGSFPLVLKKLMENPPREARLGEGGGVVRAGLGAGLIQGRGLVRAGPGRLGVREQWSSGPAEGDGARMTRSLEDEATGLGTEGRGRAETVGLAGENGGAV